MENMENKENGQSFFEKKSEVEKLLQLPEGFFLEEDEDFLILKFEGREKPIGTFSTDGATPEALREEVEDAVKEFQEEGSEKITI